MNRQDDFYKCNWLQAARHLLWNSGNFIRIWCEVGTVMWTEFWNLHAFTEANRVKAFQEVCQKDMEASVALSKLGELMEQSHESLRNLYECSHPNLDKLVQLGKGKALGSRLTGAGWVIHLTTRQPTSWLIGFGLVSLQVPLHPLVEPFISRFYF